MNKSKNYKNLLKCFNKNFIFSFLFGYSHFLCLSSPHLKHCLLSSTTSCHLTSFTPHCITLLVNALNLFVFFFSSILSLLFLQFLARWLNCLHLQHFFPFLSSNSDFILVSARWVLSILLSRLLYTSKNMVFLYLKGQFYCVVKRMYMSWVLLTNVLQLTYFTDYLCLLGHKSLPNQVSTALLATALILGLHYHFSGKIPTLIVFLRIQ